MRDVVTIMGPLITVKKCPGLKARMERGTEKEIKKLEPQGEIYRCPSCGYEDGFHVSFRFEPKSSSAEVFLICPNCHSRFRLGWRI